MWRRGKRECVGEMIPPDTLAERLHTSIMGEIVSVLRGSTNGMEVIVWEIMVERL